MERALTGVAKVCARLLDALDKGLLALAHPDTRVVVLRAGGREWW